MSYSEHEILMTRMNPRPVRFELNGDKICRLDSAANFVINTPEKPEGIEKIIRLFWDCAPAVRYEVVPCPRRSGAYQVEIGENTVTITAPDRDGVLNALKTLRQLAEEEDIGKIQTALLARGRNETIPDQWQAQILLRILSKSTVVYVSDAPDEMVAAMHMIPAHSISEALAVAKKLLGNDRPSITAIPDGISVMVVKENA